MRCGCLLVVGAVMLILLGIQGIREAHSFSKPVEITAQQFMASAPQEGWYKIKECELEVEESVYMVTKRRSSASSDFHPHDDEDTSKTDDTAKTGDQDATGSQEKEKNSPSKETHRGDPQDKAKSAGKNQNHAKEQASDTGDGAAKSDSGASTRTSVADEDDGKDITTVYIPVHCPNTLDEKTDRYPVTNLVIQTSDPAILSTVNGIKHLDQNKPDEVKKWLADNMDKLVVHKDITGMVQSGIHSEENTRKEISKLQDSLAPNYLIVDEGRTPSMAGGMGMLGGGLLLGLLSVVYWGAYILRWKQRLS